MTWQNTSVGRSISRTGLFLKKQLWIWPIIAVVILGAVGYGTRLAIESTMKENLRSQLQTLLDVEVAMLQTWFKVQETQAETLANDKQVREIVYRMLAAEEPDAGTPKPAQNGPPPDVALRRELAPAMMSYEFTGFLVADRSRKIIASTHQELIGQKEIPEYEGFFTAALDGTTVVSPPFRSVASMKDDKGRMQTGIPTMTVCAPIRDENFQVVAAIAFRIRPEREFTRILQLGRTGSTGETYAFDKDALMVSNSRFDGDLGLLGILPENAKSILNLQVHDPLGDMTKGFRPMVLRSTLHPTKMAEDAIKGNSGYDVEGYRDYRGVSVVGAWTWLPKYQIGVATEMDSSEAFHPLSILRRTFFGMFGLLILSSIAIFVFTIYLAKARRAAQKSAIEARQLGQYTLETKLGQGGMGVVYRGHHAMLRRPTAIKLLDVDKVNEASIQRFEREVQITCQLNHPNTIAIYDYGRTPEGVFYYAMEFLDGINLQTLVDRYGPLPEGRVIRILNQICGSLYEAHSIDLVHRDIKPANVMLNRRGGEADVVKVLDFGLVKALDEDKRSGLTNANAMTGTPLYMSPEAIQTPNLVDARADIYALGAVGYFLLTGRPVFEAHSLVDLCQKHVTETPIAPSQRLGKPISSEIENALMACLEKNRQRRPQTARDLAHLIARSPAANSWSMEDAEAWWGRHERESARGDASTILANHGAYEQTRLSSLDNE